MESITGALSSPKSRYILPFGIFLLLTACQDYTSGVGLFALYGAKNLLALAVLLYLFRGRFHEIEGRATVGSVLLGFLALGLWLAAAYLTLMIFGETWKPEYESLAFRPEVLNPGFERVSGLAVRLLGASIVVPLVEEVFWRSFMMRYLVEEDFEKVSLGTYTHFSFWVTVILFVTVHQPLDWLGAVLVGALYGGYLVKTKNLFGCVVAHAVTNLGLGIYIIATGEYFFW